MLAYGSPTYSVDEYVCIGETTAVECLQKFAKGVNEVFGTKYLRRPNDNNNERLLKIGDACEFPGMLVSIDCMLLGMEKLPYSMEMPISKRRSQQSNYYARSSGIA